MSVDIRTTAEIDGEIQQTKQQVQAWQARQAAIADEIAKGWDTDTASLETEYSRIEARLQAAPKRLHDLDRQRLHAAIREARTQREVALAERRAKRDEAAAVKAEVEAAEEALKQQRAALDVATRAMERAGSAHNNADNQLKRLEAELRDRFGEEADAMPTNAPEPGAALETEGESVGAGDVVPEAVPEAAEQGRGIGQ